MDVPTLVVAIGGFVLSAGIFGGLKMQNVEAPPLANNTIRFVSVISGTLLIMLGIGLWVWQSSQKNSSVVESQPTSEVNIKPTNVVVSQPTDILQPTVPAIQVESTPLNTPLPVPPTVMPTLSYAEKLCPIPIKQNDINTLKKGIVDPEVVKSQIAIFDSARIGDAGAFPKGTNIPAGVVVATNFNEQNAINWSQYPVIPIAHSGSYGLFQTLGEYITPNSGACRIIVP